MHWSGGWHAGKWRKGDGCDKRITVPKPEWAEAVLEEVEEEDVPEAALLDASRPETKKKPQRRERGLIVYGTNGSVELPPGIDWITVSPKVAEHAIRQRTAHEVKYVRGYGQALPRTVVKAEHYLLSPAFDGAGLDRRALEWCIRLCQEHPPWRLSVQQHKLWGVR